MLFMTNSFLIMFAHLALDVDDPSKIESIARLFSTTIVGRLILNILLIESYTHSILGTIWITTITIHVAPSRLWPSLSIAAVSVVCAHLKWYLATVKSGPRATAAALQQQAVAAVVRMFEEATFPAAVIDSELNIITWNSAISTATGTSLDLVKAPKVPKVAKAATSQSVPFASLQHADEDARGAAIEVLKRALRGETADEGGFLGGELAWVGEEFELVG